MRLEYKKGWYSVKRFGVLVLGFVLTGFLGGCGSKEELVAPAIDSSDQTMESSSEGESPEGAMAVSESPMGEESAAEPAESGEVGDQVNINTADASTLDGVPGIGPKMAADIIAMREEKGKFSSIEDLKGIKGIGDKTFEKMRNYLTVEGGISHGSVKASSEGEGRTSRKSGKSGEGGRSSKKAAPAGKVNLNTASADELQTLKGIGEKKALEIIEYREAHGGFKKIEEIMEIKGIGEKSFEKLKDYLTVK